MRSLRGSFMKWQNRDLWFKLNKSEWIRGVQSNAMCQTFISMDHLDPVLCKGGRMRHKTVVGRHSRAYTPTTNYSRWCGLPKRLNPVPGQMPQLVVSVYFLQRVIVGSRFLFEVAVESTQPGSRQHTRFTPPGRGQASGLLGCMQNNRKRMFVQLLTGPQLPVLVVGLCQHAKYPSTQFV